MGIRTIFYSYTETCLGRYLKDGGEEIYIENKVESFFQWKTNPKEKNIEEKYEKHKIIAQWEKKDVLYSFIGIYEIGICVFRPNSGRIRFIKDNDKSSLSGK
ncbi:MAG: hypothetical protein HFG72_08360 [Hungatella sp.]|nr:hypothetical protein [Hungatella sp.]